MRGAVDHDPVRLEPGQAADVRLICKGDPHCVSVLDVQLVGGQGGQGGQSSPAKPAAPAAKSVPAGSGFDDMDDDIPF